MPHCSVSDLVIGERADLIASHLTSHLSTPVTGAELIAFMNGTTTGDSVKNLAARDALNEVSRTIQASSQEMNSYLRVQVKNPEKPPPEIKSQLREVCIDLSYVSVIRQWDEGREKLRDRAIAWLEKVEKREIKIAPDDDAGTKASVSSRDLVWS